MPEPCFHSRSTLKNRIGIKTRPQMRNASHNAETSGGDFHGRQPGHGSHHSHGRRVDDCALGAGEFNEFIDVVLYGLSAQLRHH